MDNQPKERSMSTRPYLTAISALVTAVLVAALGTLVDYSIIDRGRVQKEGAVVLVSSNPIPESIVIEIMNTYGLHIDSVMAVSNEVNVTGSVVYKGAIALLAVGVFWVMQSAIRRLGHRSTIPARMKNGENSRNVGL